MTITGPRRAVGKRYLDLIKRFPLRPIRNENEYDAAVAVMNRLAVRTEGTLDRGEQDYLDTIAMLVSAYDDEHFAIDTSQVTPVQLLKSLMANRNMNVSELGVVIGSQPLASMILRGKRQISRKVAKILADHFGLDAGAFI